MSWSFSTTGTLQELQTIPQNDIIKQAESHNGGSGPTATDVWRAALDLIRWNAVGVNQTYKVSISGHYNPGHQSVVGMVNDKVTIAIEIEQPQK